MATIHVRVKRSLLKTVCFITFGISLPEDRPNRWERTNTTLAVYSPFLEHIIIALGVVKADCLLGL